MGKRGDSFARWYFSLGNFKKYVVSLGLALIAILPPTLISSVVVPPLLGSENQQVDIWCTPDGSSKAYVSADDPRFELIDVELIAEEACSSWFSGS
jgi:hypothetical protein